MKLFRILSAAAAMALALALGAAEAAVAEDGASQHPKYQVLHTFPTGAEGSRAGRYTLGNLLQASDGNGYGTACEGGLHDAGVIYRMTPDGRVHTVHSFRVQEGSCPLGNLIEASDGSLYGVTAGPRSGIGDDNGSIFRIDRSGTFSVVHRFEDQVAHGQYAIRGPAGGLVQASDGQLYGIYRGGGIFSHIYRLSLDGSYAVMHQFNAATEGKAPEGPLVQAGDGRLYGVAREEGVHYLGTIYRMTLAGSFEVAYAFGADRSDGYQPVGLAKGPDGALYGTTSWGGVPNVIDLGGTLFRFGLDGVYSVLRSFEVGSPAGYSPITAPVLDAAGNVYVATADGEMPSGREFPGALSRIGTDGSFVVLHRFDAANDVELAFRHLSMGPDDTLFGTSAMLGVGQSELPSEIFRLRAPSPQAMSEPAGERP
jgi:uncharacterized repeat protein (TIGR03803 family)